MGLLALASYWLLRATPATELPQAARPVSSEPDYFMRRFSVKAFDAKGTPNFFGNRGLWSAPTEEKAC